MDTSTNKFQYPKTLNVDPAVHRQAKLAATKNGEPLQTFVERALRLELERNNQQVA